MVQDPESCMHEIRNSKAKGLIGCVQIWHCVSPAELDALRVQQSFSCDERGEGRRGWIGHLHGDACAAFAVLRSRLQGSCACTGREPSRFLRERLNVGVMMQTRGRGSPGEG